MIQPNELRIGNWLLYEGKPTQVEAIDPERQIKEKGLSCSIRIKEYFTQPGGPYTTNGRWLNHFNPIPLTPEWLEKCGKKCEPGGHWEYRISVGALNWFFRYNTEWYSEIGLIYIDSRVQFVHQLQNLYFALTGQGLNFNEPKHKN